MPRTDTASRVIEAPPEKVYSALVTPDALTEWLPPTGMAGRFERFDFRIGGSYRMVLTYVDRPDAGGKSTPDSDVVEVQILELVPDARVVEAVEFVSDDPAYAGTMTVRWELTDLEGRTGVRITADGVPDGISAEDHAAGLRSSLDNLAALLGS